MDNVDPRLVDERIGDGPVVANLWLGSDPLAVAGLDRWPQIGDQYLIRGQLWRVVQETDRWVCEWDSLD